MGDFDYLMETLDEVSNQAPEQDSLATVSYTHLTLPTICSV